MGDEQNTINTENTETEIVNTETNEDEGKSIEERYNEYFGDGADTDGDESDDGSDDPEDGDSDEADDDDEETDDDSAEADEDADESEGDEDEGDASEAKAGVSTESDDVETRKLRRMTQEMEKLAKSKGYESLEEMLADENGEDVSALRSRLDSTDLTVEEKAAAYDKLHNDEAAKKREAEGKKVHDRILAELKKSVPEAASIENLSDIPNADKFRELVLKNGLSAKDAYIVATADRSRAKVAKATAAASKSHLVPSKGKTVGDASVPDSFMREAHDLYNDLTDKEIRRLYKRIK
jgi:hypothetical protein